ncbi:MULTISPECIES: AraC family transcriptional regulator [unclassified Arsukibacterium]|uniref:AraC family transcriptional regulator n=1 Tax=unclassified Arsukibacterium TaxID=2635278 RepID=UPI000C66D554|nr:MULTISPECIES: helix-turn-helix domain-containing protein [unclassified Arsukibacterium]MAA95713.1 hypothetical protein [Rheinheimera sp.]MBM35356.1 hypothetical protein [Rheinheimera sp.]HAW92070.1 hypothetical protein [Candidatus Azambacteria bacterium]|tara:strand:- start:58 stop:1161 length:1104 start_codon:yes stop_codon:yes gene_type:complete
MSSDLALVVFFLKLLLASFLITVRTGNHKSNCILGIYLVVAALDISNFVFPGFYSAYLTLDMLRANLVALEAPILFFYVKSLLQSDFHFSKHDWLHVLPLVVINVVFMPRFFLADEQGKQLFYSNASPMVEVIFTHIFLYSLMAIYLLFIFRALKVYNKVIVNTFSEHSQISKVWLTRFMQLFLFSFLVITLRNIFKFSELQLAFNQLTNLMMFTTLAFISWILWQALNRPEIFKGVNSALLPRGSTKNTRALDHDQATYNLALLTEHMRSNKPFLQANLNIDKLASATGLSAQDISQTLNHHLGQHFYDFINAYRIEAACQQLAAREHQDKTVLDILLSSGFNSKSSFNTAFKKHMKMTPSEYRNT